MYDDVCVTDQHLTNAIHVRVRTPLPLPKQARTCQTKIDVGHLYCSSHACPIPECEQAKSSKEATCASCKPAVN